ncbi:alpha/beta fold hydrolase [Methylopila musalis]|uniref:Alpha/beta fold hydrolase n=1 Tax=Methylopila musalis TaxID=1134781 RepID=A0ABW3ZAD5_9HYPH
MTAIADLPDEARASAPAREERRAPVAGGALNVVILNPPGGGEGLATLLLLHGASGNLRDLEMSIGGPLAARRRVVLVDRPGHGGSDRLGGREMAGLAAQSEAVMAALDAVGVGRVVAVGHSWSGGLAARLALDHGDRVSGLVTLAGATHPWPGGVALYTRLAAAPLVGPLFSTLIAPPVGALLFRAAVASTFAPKPMPADYLALARSRTILRPKEFRANAQDLADLKASLAEQVGRYGAIRAPTLAMTADEDHIVEPDLHSAAFVRAVPGARLAVLKGAGHMPHWTETARVVAGIEALAGEVERA